MINQKKIQPTFRLSILALACSAIFLSACSTDNIEHKHSVGKNNVTSNVKVKRQEYVDELELVSLKEVKKEDNKVLIKKSVSTTANHKDLSHAAPKYKQRMAGVVAYSSIAPILPQRPIPTVAQENRENYLAFEENSISLVSEKPVSTFSIDVDTASYSNMRRLLMQGQLPPKDSVKIEELVNYFNYDYLAPSKLESPFSVTTELAQSPWDKHKKLLHIGIKGYDINKEELPAANLVFLVDVSGSMQNPNKLGLVKKSLKLLLRQLDKEDKVSLVVYAGAAGIVLEPTRVSEKVKIERAIDKLTAGGSTNGEAGIIEAYAMAKQGFIKGGINRVIIASDGDMNVGRSSINQLKELIEKKRKSGIALTTLGFGMGNYNYALMEQLADVGNGNAAYIDNLLEAQKVLVEEMSSTLLTIAKDVKIQIEFSPRVKEYRLIGYENRLLKREDFNNDKVDAGDIGAGHTVTAIYEISLVGSNGSVDPLRYQKISVTKKPDLAVTSFNNELAFIKIRYKKPQQSHSQLITKVIKMDDVIADTKETSDNFKFSASVVAFGQLLKGGKYLGDLNYNDIIELAKQAKGEDKGGYRSQFIKLVELAKNLSPDNNL